MALPGIADLPRRTFVSTRATVVGVVLEFDTNIHFVDFADDLSAWTARFANALFTKFTRLTNVPTLSAVSVGNLQVVTLRRFVNDALSLTVGTTRHALTNDTLLTVRTFLIAFATVVGIGCEVNTNVSSADITQGLPSQAARLTLSSGTTLAIRTLLVALTTMVGVGLKIETLVLAPDFTLGLSFNTFRPTFAFVALFSWGTLNATTTTV